MAKKNYCCAQCGKVVAKLEADSGNLLMKGIRMLCDKCYSSLNKSYQDESYSFFDELLRAKKTKKW